MSRPLESWSLGDGVDFARTLEKFVSKHGWHVALGGSVLTTGLSDKDCDFIVYPHKASGHLPAHELVERIRREGYCDETMFRDHTAHGDTKLVWACIIFKQLSRRRFDLIFPGEHLIEDFD